MPQVYTLNDKLVPEMHWVPHGTYFSLKPVLLNTWSNPSVGVHIKLFFNPFPVHEDQRCFDLVVQTPATAQLKPFMTHEQAEAEGHRIVRSYSGYRHAIVMRVVRWLLRPFARPFGRAQ